VSQITFEWDNPEKTAVIWYFEPGWAWDEMYRARDRSIQHVQSVSHVVDVILDMGQSPSFPSNALSNLNAILSKGSPNRGCIILVNPSLFIQSFASMFRRVKPSVAENLMVVSSLEKARSLVAERVNAAAAINPDADPE
jgi:hypothetical protein